MKKQWFFIFVLIVSILTACLNSTSEPKTGPDVVNNKNRGQGDKTVDKPIDVTQPEEEDQQENDSVEEEPTQEITIEPMYKINESHWGLEPINGANEKVVLVTIDDAPDKYSVEMAKTLKKLNTPAIFFVNGHFLDTEQEKQRLKEIYDMGFTIGNHTYNHQKLNDVSEDKQREEIIKLSDLITEITGEKPTFFRAPHGVNTDYVKQLVKDEGMTLMNWTYGYDYFKPYMNAEKLKTAMITGEGPEVGVSYSLLKPGANLLMHDRSWTAEALKDIITGLKEKGFGFVEPQTIITPSYIEKESKNQ